MRIAIDARELAGNPTGVGRYLGAILGAWGELPAAAAHEFLLCAPEPLQRLPETPLALTTAIAPGRGTVWEQRVLPRLARGADVLFAPGYGGPLRLGMPMVITIHDVSFFARPDWFSWREGVRRRFVTRRSAHRAARVITVSEFSKREIVRYIGVPASKVDVIYSGVTRLPARPAARREPRVLYVGSLFNRRHIPALIDGFSRMAERHRDARLDIVGDNRTRPHVNIDAIAARSPAGDRIRVRAYVSDEELASLYGTASAFAFLSEYEGFALTPLEALGAGVPVLLLDTEVAREIYGAAAMYVQAADPALIAGALERLLFDVAERDRLRSGADRQLERYDWHESARRTLQVLLACAR